jgi:ketosteroid isomerase-like protein
MKILRRFAATAVVIGWLLQPFAASPPALGDEGSQAAIKSNDAVRQATLNFYVALNSAFKGDLGPMTTVWSHGSDVVNMPSSGGRAVGWNSVLEGYRNLARQSIVGSIAPAQIMVVVQGSMGYSICFETGETRSTGGYPVKHNERASNIFRLEVGRWKLVSHHSDPVYDPDAVRR